MLLSGLYLFSKRPFIAGIPDSVYPNAVQLARGLGLDCHFLVFPMWFTGTLKATLIRSLRSRMTSRKIKTTWMCATKQEARLFKLMGEDSIWCHHNLYCCEKTFDVRADIDSVYDAVYVARLDAYKRIWLARFIEKLCIVSANFNDRANLDSWGCSHAILNRKWLSRDEVCSTINQAKCGLALSAREGGMFATTEYLLCGKPVVSTKSQGGRDVWFSSVNHVLVDDTPEDVFEKVRGLNSLTFDKERIRDDAIVLLKKFRLVLSEFVERKSEGGVRLMSSGNLSGEDLRALFVHERDWPELFLSLK
jgi:hypothetical protein